MLTCNKCGTNWDDVGWLEKKEVLLGIAIVKCTACRTLLLQASEIGLIMPEDIDGRLLMPTGEIQMMRVLCMTCNTVVREIPDWLVAMRVVMLGKELCARCKSHPRKVAPARGRHRDVEGQDTLWGVNSDGTLTPHGSGPPHTAGSSCTPQQSTNRPHSEPPGHRPEEEGLIPF